MPTKYCGKDLLIQKVFTPSGAWAALTVYALGAVVTNGGNVYECIVAGTSAASGGPSTTSESIVDATVTWAYVSATTGGNGYRTIAGMRSTSLKINNEQVDVTDKGDVPWRQLLACGIRSMELSASGIFSSALSLTQMMTDTTAGTISSYRVISGRGDTFVGSYLPTSCERNGEYNGAEQYSLSLASAGAVVYTPAP